MIIVNKKKYENLTIDVYYGDYNVTKEGKKRTGLSPFISFKTDNIKIGIETIYDKEWLKELNESNKKDISKFVSDIVYEDEEGWVSLITGDYKCFIEKIDDKEFTLDFSCNAIEGNINFDILINEKIKLL